MRTIFLVCHADKVSEETDAPLSDAGRRHAECGMPREHTRGRADSTNFHLQLARPW